VKVLYLDQVGGVSGDMLLGTLVGLGVDPAAMERALASLGAGEIRLVTSTVERAGFPATHVSVLTEETAPAGHDQGHAHEHERSHTHDHTHDHSHPHQHPHAHRSFTDIVTLIQASGLPEPVVRNAIAVFRRLGEAEAAVHGTGLEEVHFHEVGALDSIADIVGACWGLNELGVEAIASSPFLIGRGQVRMAHGTWPAPAPATLKLLEGQAVRLTDLEGETVTPTGAALIVTLAGSIGGEIPMTIRSTAAGAGSREWPDRPNVLRGYLGESVDGAFAADEVEVIEAAIDDMSPELMAHLATALFEAGAVDVYGVPALMKKGRPGHVVTVLATAGTGRALAECLFRESTTLGVRHRREKRWILERYFLRVETPWGIVSVKCAKLPGGSIRAQPEFEDCARLAREAGVPLIDVMEAARKATSIPYANRVV
jgi:uncharacterized protein (TIGR00299 family) protein